MLPQRIKQAQAITYDDVVILEKGLGEKSAISATKDQYLVVVAVQFHLCLVNQFAVGHLCNLRR